MNVDTERWIELATYDLTTAEAMLASGRYLYVLFCSQQAIEKRLKAQVIEHTQTFPPRTHDLIKLAAAGGISLPETWDIFLRTLMKYYIGTRYPEDIRSLASEVTKEIASLTLSQTKGFIEWLNQQPK